MSGITSRVTQYLKSLFVFGDTYEEYTNGSVTTFENVSNSSSNSLNIRSILGGIQLLSASGKSILLNGSSFNSSGVLTLATALAPTSGGTGQSTYTTGDILYASASNTLSKLPGNTTTTTKFLSQTGDSVNSAAPSWVAGIPTTDINITNDTSTNAVMYPTWVTATSGILPIYVANTKLTFNPSSGLLTSSGLSTDLISSSGDLNVSSGGDIILTAALNKNVLATTSGTGGLASTSKVKSNTYQEYTNTTATTLTNLTNSSGSSINILSNLGGISLTSESTHTISLNGSLFSGTGRLALTGPLVASSGGTGYSTYTDLELLVGSTTGSNLLKKVLQGTSNQITVTNNATTVVLSTPQNIATTSNVTFNQVQTPNIVSSTDVTITPTSGLIKMIGSAFTLSNASVSAPTAPTEVNINSSTQNMARITLSGQEFYQAANTSTDGPCFLVGVNRSGNRQLWIADSAALTSNTTNPVVRVVPSTSGSYIESVATDGTTILPFKIQPTGGSTTVGGALAVTGQLTTGSFTISSYTPTIGDGTNNFSMSAQNGNYIVLGNLCFFWARISWSNTGFASGSVRLSTPFTLVTVPRAAITLGICNSIGTGTQKFLSAAMDSGNSYAWLLKNTLGAGAIVQVSDFSGLNGEIQYSGVFPK